MTPLDPLLGGTRPAGLYRIAGGDPEALHHAVEERGWDAASISGPFALDKAGLLAQFALALRFPDWFGHNWDALVDCLHDLSWAPAEAWVVLWTDADLMARTEPETLAMALDILAEATVWWREQGQRFSSVVVGTHPALSDLPPLEATS